MNILKRFAYFLILPFRWFGRLCLAILDDVERPQKEELLGEMTPAELVAELAGMSAPKKMVQQQGCKHGFEPWYCDACALEREKVKTDHEGHGAGTPEDGPVDGDCPCRGSELQDECRSTGCGFCLAASPMHAQGPRWLGYNLCGSTSSKCTTDDLLVTCDECIASINVQASKRTEKKALPPVTVKPVPVEESLAYSREEALRYRRELEWIHARLLNARNPRDFWSLFTHAGSEGTARLELVLGLRRLPQPRTEHFQGVNPLWGKYGSGNYGAGTPAHQEATRVYSGSCDVCHQVWERDQLSYVDLKEGATFPDGSLQLQVCPNEGCRAHAQELKDHAEFQLRDKATGG